MPRFLLLGLLVATSCSYQAPLRTQNLTPLLPPAAAQVGLTLSDDRDAIRDIVFTVDAVTFRYDVREAYFSAVERTLVASFGRVVVGSKKEPNSAFFAVPRFETTTISSGGGVAQLRAISGIDLFSNDGGTVLQSYQATQDIHYQNPPSATALGFITGLTLLVLSPITIPTAIRIEGNHGRDLIESAIHRSFEGIGAKLRKDAGRFEEGRRIEACYQAIPEVPALSVLTDHLSLGDYRSQSLEMLSSPAKPTAAEKVAISQWDALLIGCAEERDAFMQRWNTPAPIRALFDETEAASQNLRVLLYTGQLTYGEYARERRDVGNAFATALAEIERELAKDSAEAEARAKALAMQAQQVNLARIQARELKVQTFLMGVQTINQVIAMNQQRQQHQELMNQLRLNHQQVLGQLNRSRYTTCSWGWYQANCVTW